MHLARWLQKAMPANFKPYKALMITADLLASLPNSGPNMIHTFSVTGACTYAFKMLPNLTSRSLKAAIIKAILTVSLDAMLAYVV